jgi:quercetin dioxygenase-like cupin family protein
MMAEPGTGLISVVPDRGATVEETHLTCSKLSADHTDAYCVFKVSVPPGAGTPLHRHAAVEMMHVLAGEFIVACASGIEILARCGDSVHIPAGELHGFRNVGTELGQLLAIV